MTNKLKNSDDGPIWDNSTRFDLTLDKFKKISLPKADLCDAQFDVLNGQVRKLFLIFSSPRSGSTALCNYLHESNLCIPHEYFQPYQYMPLLAKRWAAEDGGILSPEKYIDSLSKFRVKENGILGINIHGSHLGIFKYFKEFFSNQVEISAVILKRRDKIAQAVSYYIASKSKAWSSHFVDNEPTPEYDFEEIRKKLIAISTQEVLIDKYTAHGNFSARTVFYEDLCEKPFYFDMQFSKKSGVHYIDMGKTSIRKQSKSINKRYAQRFREELAV